MTIRITSVHPVTGRVIFTSLLNYLGYHFPLTTFISGTPEKNGRLVTVSQDHTTNTLLVHGFISLIPTDEFLSMSLITRFIYHIETILSGIFQISGNRWIMRGSYSIEIKLLQDGNVFQYQFIGNMMSLHPILHVRTFSIDLQFLTIQIEDAIFNFRFLEAHHLTS